jgi:hypothetical protein
MLLSLKEKCSKNLYDSIVKMMEGGITKTDLEMSLQKIKSGGIEKFKRFPK